MAEPIRRFKIKGMPKCKEYNALPFGRRMEHNATLANFKANAKTIHLSQKRQTYAKAILEAIDLYNVDQYFCQFYCDNEVKDHSFEFFYTVKTPT